MVRACDRARFRLPAGQVTSTGGDSRQKRQLNLNLADWPVARRLFAVIVAALLMGLVFGGLRVADAENSASQFSRTQQLAKLGAQLVNVVDDLQNERDATLVNLLGGNNSTTLATLQAKTNSDLGPVRPAARRDRERRLPLDRPAAASTVNNAVSADSIADLQKLASTALRTPSAVFDDYAADISDMITLRQQVALGVTDGR